MRIIPSIVLTIVLALSLACADKTPASFKYDPTTAAVTNTNYFTLHVSVVNKKGEIIAGQTPSYSGGPADVLEVSADGNLRCAKSGDATLTLASGPLSEPVALKCRIPTEITVPPELQVVIDSPVALNPRVLGEGARPLDGVTVDVTSSDPSILTVEGDTLKGVAIGKARLQSSVGAITSVTAVEVLEKVVSETLALREGANRTFTLQPAYYLVVIETKVDPRLKQGVTVGWSGSACANQPENTSHRFNCRVEETSTMTVTNPKLMGIGATVNGTLNVYRAPG